MGQGVWICIDNCAIHFFSRIFNQVAIPLGRDDDRVDGGVLRYDLNGL